MGFCRCASAPRRAGRQAQHSRPVPRGDEASLMGSFLRQTAAPDGRQSSGRELLLAADLWNGIPDWHRAGRGSFAEAVLDTVPLTHRGAARHRRRRGGVRVRSDVGTRTTSAGRGDALRARTWLESNGWPSPSNAAEGGAPAERLRLGAQQPLGPTPVRSVLPKATWSQVERIARLAGRMYLVLRGAQASKIQGVPSEVYSVEQGNDLGRLHGRAGPAYGPAARDGGARADRLTTGRPSTRCAASPR